MRRNVSLKPKPHELRHTGMAAAQGPIVIGTLAGNHPYPTRSMSSSFARPTRTSTSSASSASHCRCAPSVPGPRDEILPADDTTRCHGTGGLASGERNLSAVTNVTITVVHMPVGDHDHATSALSSTAGSRRRGWVVWVCLPCPTCRE